MLKGNEREIIRTYINKDGNVCCDTKGEKEEE